NPPRKLRRFALATQGEAVALGLGLAVAQPLRESPPQATDPLKPTADERQAVLCERYHRHSAVRYINYHAQCGRHVNITCHSGPAVSFPSGRSRCGKGSSRAQQAVE